MIGDIYDEKQANLEFQQVKRRWLQCKASKYAVLTCGLHITSVCNNENTTSWSGQVQIGWNGPVFCQSRI